MLVEYMPYTHNNPLSSRPIPVNVFRTITSQVRDIPIENRLGISDEPLVDVSSYGLRADSYYARSDGSNYPYKRRLMGADIRVLVRRSVAVRLQSAESELAAFGLGVVIFDGYRRVETQRDLWQFFWDSFKDSNPDATEDELIKHVSTFASDPRQFDPNDVHSWPLHSTGGSVDVMLCETDSGHLLDMGAQYDDATELSATDFFELELSKGRVSSDDTRLLNRRILYWAMIYAGFTNYPYEYWHFDWGNQMYVAMQNAATGTQDVLGAWYGYVSWPYEK